MDESQETSFSDQPSSELDQNELTTGEKSGEITRKKRQLLYLVINAFLGSFVIGYALTISNISYQFSILEEDSDDDDFDFQQAIHTALVPVSGSIASFLVGSKVFQFGRRINLIFADIMTIIGSSIICGSGKKLYLSAISMTLLGIGVGVNSIMIPQYILEYASCQYGKGLLMISHQFCIISGITMSYIWGVIFSSEDDSKYQWLKWVIYSIPLGFAAFRIFALIFFFPKDTPFFYLLRGYKKQAQSTLLLFFTHAECNKLLEFFEIKRARQLEDSSTFVDMLKVRYRRRMAIGSMLNFFCYSSGVFTILLYSYEVLTNIRDDNTNMLRTLIVGLTLVFAQFFQIYFSQFMGRKTLLLVGQSIYVLGFAGLTTFDAFSTISNRLDVVVLFQSIVCIGFAFESSAIHILISEILPERGIAAAQFVCLSSIAIGAVVYPVFQYSYQIFLPGFSLIFSILGFAAFYKYVKETRGLTNYEIEKVYTENFQGILNHKDQMNSSTDTM